VKSLKLFRTILMRIFRETSSVWIRKTSRPQSCGAFWFPLTRVFNLSLNLLPRYRLALGLADHAALHLYDSVPGLGVVK
jgi:hypothetical protein